MGHAEKVYVRSFLDAMRILVFRIVDCLRLGGDPKMFLPGIRDDGYVGVDVVCVGRVNQLPTIRLLAPPSPQWLQVLRRMSYTKGDWKWILAEYGKLFGITPDLVAKLISQRAVIY